MSTIHNNQRSIQRKIMQRSSNSNRQSLSSSSSTSSTGRRTYNRSHNNNFKFHNFVFNETNQKFCLEEQHGNKKITVLHWKSSDDQQQRQQLTESVKQEQKVRNCDSDSKLIKSNKLNYIPRLLEIDELKNYHHYHQYHGSSTTEMDIINDRINNCLASSASFPLAFRSSVNSPSAYESPSRYQINESFTLSSLPHPSDNNSWISSGHSSTSFLSSAPLDSPPSSNCNFSRRNDAKNCDESTSKSHYSGSSIATTSSSCSAINFSLDNLKLNESLNRQLGSRRKPNRVRRVLVKDDDSDESDHDSDFEDKDDEIFYRTYRQKIQQRIENLIDETTLQSQPLDLSIKSKHEFNNKNKNDNNKADDFNIDTTCYKNNHNEKDEEIISVCDSVESPRSTTRFADSPSKFKSYSNIPGLSNCIFSERHASESMRTESLSPSELILSIKCCSPLLDGRCSESKSHQRQTSLPSNPFTIFPEHEHRSKISESFKPSSDNCSHSSDIFDALLEEEIHKFLHTSSSFSTNNKRQSSDFNKKIEDKLKLLQQEVLNNKLSESDFFNFMSDSSNDNNLKMHFKFDSNKNLEPYMDGYKTRTSSNLSSQLLSQSTNTLSRTRLNHRNQIKRHLEDAFKQNGFLVKTKQVSDANNSAMFCKFRQLRKYTRYYLKSWQNHLPDEVNKLWKGFLPPKSERPIFLTSASEDTSSGCGGGSSSTSIPSSSTSTLNLFMSSME